MSGKYGPLRKYLETVAERGDQSAEFSFSDIEVLVGRLPASARQYRPWWANNSQSQSLAWREAGWHVARVSLDQDRVRFERGVRGGTYADRGKRPSPRGQLDQGPPTPTTSTTNVVLVGCVKQKADLPLPARELYTSPLFARRRAYADSTGAPWFVISGQWGLVHPEQMLAPYDLYLGAQPMSYRRAWGQFVVEQLAVAVPLSVGITVEIHAGRDYIDVLTEPLDAYGVAVSTPVQVGSMGEMLQWYDRNESVPADGSNDVSAAIATLSNPAGARTKAELTVARQTLDSPGLYSWWVDEAGAIDLSRGLGHRVLTGLIYAGQAGATRAPSGTTSSATLASRLLSQHFNGSTEGSTFRLTIASILTAAFVRRVDKTELSQWMQAHLRAATWSTSNATPLLATERAALDALDPPLNLDEVARTALRAELIRLRGVYRVPRA